jgi:hypothetical protein
MTNSENRQLSASTVFASGAGIAYRPKNEELTNGWADRKI